MRLWRELRSWLRAALWRSRMEREMDTELRFHMEAFSEDLVGSGVWRSMTCAPSNSALPKTD